MINGKLLGLGTAAIGRPQYINIRQQGVPAGDLAAFRRRGMQLLQYAYECGIRHFDTAPGYGMAENMIQEWLDLNAPQEISISTKWGYTYTANFSPNATVHEVKEHSLAKLNEQWQTSRSLLPQLRTYQIHSATLETGVLENDEVLHRLAYLKEAFGLQIGMTTTGANQAEVMARGLNVMVNAQPLFDSFQVTFNVFDQSLGKLLKEAVGRGKSIIIKEALANGRVFPSQTYRHYQPAYEYLGQLADQYRVGIDAVALRFCLDSLPKVLVLSGASTEEQLVQNLLANSFTLTEEEMNNLHGLAVPAGEYWGERKRMTWN
jgi:aryl-alcohol dehydrogenase-like predicted oxidoreductase